MKIANLYGPPGTGKTHALVSLAEHVVRERGPQALAFITYTRAAAREIKQRLAPLVSRSQDPETVDRLFGDAPGAVAGEHGGAVRRAVGAPVERPDLPSPPDSWLEAAEQLVQAFPGALLERKARGFALHYRNDRKNNSLPWFSP